MKRGKERMVFSSPALLLATIAGTGALLGSVVVWARQRRDGETASRPVGQSASRRDGETASRQAGKTERRRDGKPAR